MRGARDPRRLVSGWRLVAVVVGAAALLGGACGQSTGSVQAAQERVTAAEQGVDEAAAALEQAGATFCGEAKDYILAIDRYGKLFTDGAATVGDVQTLGADLAEPRESTATAAQGVLGAHDALNAANQELADARSALASAQASAPPGRSPVPPVKVPPSSSPQVPSASVERVKQAESDLEAASEGINAATPLRQAGETYTSAAFALEAAWINLFADASCLTDEQSKEAASAVRDYTTALQKRLKEAEYYDGEVDGVYGPETVKAVEDLQREAGLPVTGLVDRATSMALDDAVSTKGGEAATEDLVEATSVQTALKLAGYWPGAIDGEWTPELTDALQEFQADLGVEPTGVVDAATLAALEEALEARASAGPSPTPSASPSPSG
jgi:murein L,D-transpeptidase YcbB/YkuD